MKICFINGHFTTAIHGPYDPHTIFQPETTRPLTGSDSAFFNAIRGLAERGHEVFAYADVTQEVENSDILAGANIRKIGRPLEEGCDAYISLNESDQLRKVTKGDAPRILQMQLNDFAPHWNSEGFHEQVDIFVFVSPVQRHIIRLEKPIVPEEKCCWIPNSINLEMFERAPGYIIQKITPKSMSRIFEANHDRMPGSLAWCSSPDRGLHWLLRIFTQVREEIPDATLDIYYRLEKWIKDALPAPGTIGFRAKYIKEALEKLGRKGENGVYVHDAVPNYALLQALLRTDIFPYTCDTVTFTEGFSVSTMDACAAGSIPLVSGVDALGEIYGPHITTLERPRASNEEVWTEKILETMRLPLEEKEALRKKAKEFAASFDRHKTAAAWESLIEKNLRGRGKTPDLSGMYRYTSEWVEVNRLPSPSKKTISAAYGKLGATTDKTEAKSDEPPHRKWCVDPNDKQALDVPRGGRGPICTECGESTWIELGGADSPFSYHPNIDVRPMDGVDIVHDLRKMPLPLHDGHAEKVKSIQNLNHLPYVDAKNLLADTLRVLRPGGELYIVITDLKFCMERALEDGLVFDWMNCLYGTTGDTHEHDFHYWGYSPESLQELLESLGYEKVTFHGHINAWEFKMSAYKPAESSREEKPKAPSIGKKTPEVSVIVSTFRPGGIDMTFAGMRDQTFRDFELVLVDKRYSKRNRSILGTADRCGIKEKLIHVPEHRSNGKWVTFCSGWNTGIAVARGEKIIFLQDYAYAPPGWIEAHLAAIGQDPNKFVIAPYNYFDPPELRTLKPYDFHEHMRLGDRCTEIDETLIDVLGELEVFAKGLFDPSWISQLTIGKGPYAKDQWRECRDVMHSKGSRAEPSWVHIKNESCYRSLMLKINGLDERLERGKGPMDIDVGIRLVNAGAELVWADKAPRPACINARFFCRNHPWGAMHERLEGRWSYDDGLRYNEMQKARKVFYAQNLYRMEDLAAELESWRDANPYENPPAPRDIPDDAYWRKQIWPETPLFWTPDGSKRAT